MKSLIVEFQANKNPARAKQMSKYMRELYPYFGIQKPERARISKPFIEAFHSKPNIDKEEVEILWNKDEREFLYVGLDSVIKSKKKLVKEDIDFIQTLIVTKPWWDSVDLIATNLVGSLLLRYPELKSTHLLDWAHGNVLSSYQPDQIMWLKRTSIIFQNSYKMSTDTDFLSRAILLNCGTTEFFLNKAIGWALRSYARTNQTWVKEFLDQNHTRLHPLSIREASKHFTYKVPK